MSVHSQPATHFFSSPSQLYSICSKTHLPLILGSLYPNGSYTSIHNNILRETNEWIYSQKNHYVIDFLSV
jgi:hypothetical protein